MEFSSETRCPKASSKVISKLIDIKTYQFSILEDLFFLLDTCSWGRSIQLDYYAVSFTLSEVVGSWNDPESGKEKVKIWQQKCQKYTDTGHTYSFRSLRASSFWSSNSAATWPGKSRETCKSASSKTSTGKAASCGLVHTGQSAPHSLVWKRIAYSSYWMRGVGVGRNLKLC